MFDITRDPSKRQGLEALSSTQMSPKGPRRLIQPRPAHAHKYLATNGKGPLRNELDNIFYFIFIKCVHAYTCVPQCTCGSQGTLARVGSLFLPCMSIRTLACVHSDPVPCQSHLPLPRCRVDLLARNQHLLLRTVSHTGRTANFFCSEKARPPGLQSMCSSRGYQNVGTCLYLAYPRAVGALSPAFTGRTATTL